MTTTGIRPQQGLAAEMLADTYWRKMRFGALREVELKLAQYKRATPSTMKFWLAVHARLEKKAEAAKAAAERKAKQ